MAYASLPGAASPTFLNSLVIIIVVYEVDYGPGKKELEVTRSVFWMSWMSYKFSTHCDRLPGFA